MKVFYLLLLVIAAACFALAVVIPVRRVNLLAVGLLAWVLVPLIQQADHVAD